MSWTRAPVRYIVRPRLTPCSNAHCVLAKPARFMPFAVKALSADGAAKGTEPRQRLYVVSANDEVAATESIRQLLMYVEEHPEVFHTALPGNLEYTLGQRRSHLPWRLGAVASSLNDLVNILAKGDITPSRASSRPPRVAFA